MAATSRLNCATVTGIPSNGGGTSETRLSGPPMAIKRGVCSVARVATAAARAAVNKESRSVPQRGRYGAHERLSESAQPRAQAKSFYFSSYFQFSQDWSIPAVTALNIPKRCASYMPCVYNRLHSKHFTRAVRDIHHSCTNSLQIFSRG